MRAGVEIKRGCFGRKPCAIAAKMRNGCQKKSNAVVGKNARFKKSNVRVPVKKHLYPPKKQTRSFPKKNKRTRLVAVRVLETKNFFAETVRKSDWNPLLCAIHILRKSPHLRVSGLLRASPRPHPWAFRATRTNTLRSAGAFSRLPRQSPLP